MRPLQFLCALTLLSPAAFAQHRPEVLARTGDPIPGVGIINGFEAVHVNGAGTTVILARTDVGDVDLDASILRNGDVYRRGGDTVPVLGGHWIQFNGLDLAENGDIAFSTVIKDAPGHPTFLDALYVNDTATLLEGVAAPAGFDPGSWWFSFGRVVLGEADHLIVTGSVWDDTESPKIVACMARIDYDPAGNLVSQTLLAKRGSLLPGLPGALASFGGPAQAVTLNAAGVGLWRGDMDVSVGSTRHLVYRDSGQLLIQSDTPSGIVPGRNWGNIAGSGALSVDEYGGNTLIRSVLDTTDFSDDGVLVLNGNLVLREGDSPGVLPADTLVNFSQSRARLTTDGIGWAGTLSSGFDSPQGVFLGTEVVALQDLTLTQQDELITAFLYHQDLVDYARNGTYIAYQAVIDEGPTAILLAERVEQSSYCSANPNSTGDIGITTASGSAAVADNALWIDATGLPSNEFGYGLVSATTADVQPPGSEGRLCLGGSIGRFSAQVQSSGADGRITTVVDLTALPLTPEVAVQPGETWHFQAWHRDMTPNPTSNFSLPVSVTFH